MISIIVTTYNVEQYVAQCLESIVKQTYQDLEIIVVDDASSDGTRTIVHDFAARDSRISIVQFELNTPGGVGTPANAGLEVAKGDFIGFVDGDDWCEPDMFESLHRVAVATGAQVVLGAYDHYLTDDQRTRAAPGPMWDTSIATELKVSGVDIKRSLLKLSPVPWRKLYRRDLIEDTDVRFPEGDFFYEDEPFQWFCVTKASSFAYVPAILCHHRINRPGQTTSAKIASRLAIYQHHATIFSFLQRIDLYDTFGEDLVAWILRHSGGLIKKMHGDTRERLLSELRSALLLHGEAYVRDLIDSKSLSFRCARVAKLALSSATRVSTSPIGRAECGDLPVVTEGYILIREFYWTIRRHGVRAALKRAGHYLGFRAHV